MYKKLGYLLEIGNLHVDQVTSGIQAMLVLHNRITITHGARADHIDLVQFTGETPKKAIKGLIEKVNLAMLRDALDVMNNE